MKQANLLIVEDDLISLKLLQSFLKTENFTLYIANDGEEASRLIQQKPKDFFHCIISDYLMPNKDGIQLLEELKQDPEYKKIPFILQTSANSEAEIQRGINAGAFYYLIKPITKETLISVVNAALKDFKNHREALTTIEGINSAFPLMKSGHFQFQTLDEAKHLSNFIAFLTKDPNSIGIGYLELMINAVEHGNLGITYDEKTQLINDARLHDEIAYRLSLPENQEKYVTVDLDHSDSDLTVTITDMGPGFDYEKYLEFSIDRAMDNHGRGIMMANKLSFDDLEYSENGRKVRCKTTQLRT
ncbi:response regulator [Hydrogenovibrio sp. 3SP14C1]|uniref:response regulator n=1 Tax=Hydrogenovibrio sp. 3SP14C1 TaxID=3038774 RepID=UPI002415C276|nr:response regulator [Hydrogenovibrio sp. 3SP14C1]MDG4813232.1 response regulator [Hydrogenovibrio sp. 3SP14C1]